MLGCGRRGESSGCRPHPLLDAPEEAHGKDHGKKLDGQHPYGEGSSQVDIGFEGVEDHCVAALLVQEQFPSQEALLPAQQDPIPTLGFSPAAGLRHLVTVQSQESEN